MDRLLALEAEVEELRARVVELETVRTAALEEYDLPIVEGEQPTPQAIEQLKRVLRPATEGT